MNVCCVAAVVKDIVFSIGELKYVVFLCVIIIIYNICKAPYNTLL